MLRLLALIILVLLIWMVLSALLTRLRGGGARRGGSRPVEKAGPPGEPLLRCESCGVRVPASRILPSAGGEVFCSEDCRRRGPRTSA